MSCDSVNVDGHLAVWTSWILNIDAGLEHLESELFQEMSRVRYHVQQVMRNDWL
jgi:hypothetical protein